MHLVKLVRGEESVEMPTWEHVPREGEYVTWPGSEGRGSRVVEVRHLARVTRRQSDGTVVDTDQLVEVVLEAQVEPAGGWRRVDDRCRRCGYVGCRCPGLVVQAPTGDKDWMYGPESECGGEASPGADGEAPRVFAPLSEEEREALLKALRHLRALGYGDEADALSGLGDRLCRVATSRGLTETRKVALELGAALVRQHMRAGMHAGALEGIQRELAAIRDETLPEEDGEDGGGS